TCRCARHGLLRRRCLLRWACGSCSAESSDTSWKSQLPPCFVHHDRDRVGEIEAAIVGLHRQPQALRFGNGRKNVGGQTAGLAPEQERIAIAKGGVCV